MNFLIAGLALLGFSADPPVDARTVAELFRSYGTQYKNVQFLYEGTISPVDKNVPPVSFQGSYTYRSDGATLIDLFYLGGGRPTTRLLSSLLRNQQEDLEASPDYLPPLRDREPRISASGSGALDRPDTPERFFLASFFRGHVNVEEYGLEPQGWEEIDGHRCLVVRSYLGRRPQPNAPARPRSYHKLWLDLERDGHPLRIDRFDGDKIAIQTFVTLERLARPLGRLTWFPSEARTSDYGMLFDRGVVTRKTEPDYFETCKILGYTLKFDQGLSDTYFSTKKQALVASDETLAKLKREMEAYKPPAKIVEPSDPESRNRRLNDALTRADAQSARLEASSAARAGGHWSVVFLPWALLLAAMLSVGFLLHRSWSRR